MTGKLPNDAQRSSEVEAAPQSADSEAPQNAQNKVDFKARLAALWARQSEIKDS